MLNHTSPHEREYLAAIGYMAEHTPSPAPNQKCQEPAVGDFVSGCSAGKRWSGHVEWISGKEMCINPGGEWLFVPVNDITH